MASMYRPSPVYWSHLIGQTHTKRSHTLSTATIDTCTLSVCLAHPHAYIDGQNLYRARAYIRICMCGGGGSGF